MRVHLESAIFVRLASLLAEILCYGKHTYGLNYEQGISYSSQMEFRITRNRDVTGQRRHSLVTFTPMNIFHY
jgi:hypothetical protein